LTTYLELSSSKYDLAERSFHIARDILGKPVGKQDEYAAAFG
jgi:galactokinase/mevalonate kinase-like predicted kinase